LKCMKTLATNSEKAALVRFLTIEYPYDHINRNCERRMTTYLLKSLINMRSLSDFRVRPRLGMEELTKGLGKILCQGHFRLQTLYCQDYLSCDVSQIIKSQTELQILGLYSPGNPGHILKSLKELHSAQLFLPTVFTLQFAHTSPIVPVTDHISIFPAFYSVGRRAAIPQVLAQSLCKDQGTYMVAKAENICGLSIYLIDSSDMPSISALAMDMAVSFPRIEKLKLFFERRCKIPLQDIKEEFSFFNLSWAFTDIWPRH